MSIISSDLPNPVRQAGQVLFPMKAIQAKEYLMAQPKSPSHENNGPKFPDLQCAGLPEGLTGPL